MSLNTDHLAKCITVLESSLQHLNLANSNSIEYEIYRNAAIKGFELSLETAGKLLRKTLKLYSGNPREIDELTYKDIFRRSSKHAILDTEAVKRWFKYRDNRNNTAHDYGKEFAEETLRLLPLFIKDARELEITLKKISEK